MHKSILSAALIVFLGSPLVGAEVLYFKNHRIIEAQDHRTEGRLIYITMTNGKEVYLPADEVDWDTTERIKAGNFTYQTLPYEEAGQQADGKGAPTAGSIKLTNTDLKGLKARRFGARGGNFYRISGATPWTDTGIDLKANQQITISGQGAIKLWKIKDSPPFGIEEESAAGEPKVILDRGFGSLLGRVGAAGVPFYCGTSKVFRSPIAGRLYLGPNDTTPDDNSGFWDVKIQHENERKYAPGFSTTGYRAPTAAAGGGTSGGGESASAGAPPAIRDDFKRGRSGY